MAKKWFASNCKSPTDSVDTLQSTLASKTSPPKAVKDLFTFVHFFVMKLNKSRKICLPFNSGSLEHITCQVSSPSYQPIQSSKNSVKPLEVNPSNGSQNLNTEFSPL